MLKWNKTEDNIPSDNVQILGYYRNYINGETKCLNII